MLCLLSHRLRLLFTSGLFLAATSFSAAIPAFPGAAGFGSQTTAGRAANSQVIKVTNLNNSGTGSLRAALLTPGHRYIIFEVSGIIRLTAPIQMNVNHSYATIAGQTAPAPGIIVEGETIRVLAHDVLFQHLALRPGKKTHIQTSPPNPNDPQSQNPGYEMARRDGVSVGAVSAPNTPQADTYNVVFDHCSFTWSADEIVETWSNGTWGAATTGKISDVTFSNCIFAEALYNGGHAVNDNGSGGPEAHSMGPLIGRNSRRISLIRNLMAFNEQRNPMMRDDVTEVLVVNNFVYHPGTWTGHRIHVGSKGSANVPQVASIKGNVVVLPPGYSDPRAIYVHADAPTSTSVYLSGNRSNIAGTSTWHPTDGNQWNSNLVHLGKAITQLGTEPAIFTQSSLNLPPVITGQAAIEAHVLQNAGARPAARDVVDARIVGQVQSRITNGFIDGPEFRIGPGTFSSGELAGYPAWTQLNVTRTPPANPNDIMPSGYSRIEEWLHTFSAALEPGGSGGVVYEENFNDGQAQNWSAVVGTWSVASGYYQQTANDYPDVAVYNGQTWGTNFTYGASLRTSWSAMNNRVGLIYNYVNANNYYYVIFNASGLAEVNRVIAGGAPVVVASGAYTGGGSGVWFDVDVVRSGSSTTILVNGNVVFSNVSQPELGAGKIGFITRFNASARFDNVVVTTP